MKLDKQVYLLVFVGAIVAVDYICKTKIADHFVKNISVIYSDSFITTPFPDEEGEDNNSDSYSEESNNSNIIQQDAYSVEWAKYRNLLYKFNEDIF